MINDILVGAFDEKSLKEFLDSHGAYGFHELHNSLTDLKVQLNSVYHNNYKKQFKVYCGELVLVGDYHTVEEAANDFLVKFGLQIIGNIIVETKNTVVMFEVVEKLFLQEI